MKNKILLLTLAAFFCFQNLAFPDCPPVKGFDEKQVKNLHIVDSFEDNILENSDVESLIESQKDKYWIDLLPAESYPFRGHHEKLIQLINQYHQLEKSEKTLLPARRRALKKIIDQSHHDLGKSFDQTVHLVLQTAVSKRDYLRGLSSIGTSIAKILFHLPGRKDAPVRHLDSSYHYEVLQHTDPGGRTYESLKELLMLWSFCKQEAEFEHSSDGISKRNYPEFFLWLEDPFFTHFPFDTLSRTDLFPDTRKVIFDEEGKAYSSEYGEPSGKILMKEGKEYHPIRKLTYHYMVDENGSLYVRDKGYHSYVNRGKPALSAGMIKFEDYKIRYIDSDSGHYKPTEAHLTEAVKKLTEKYGSHIFSKSFQMEIEFRPPNRHLVTSAMELYQIAPLLTEEQKSLGIAYVSHNQVKSVNDILHENKDLLEEQKKLLPAKRAKKILKELEEIRSLSYGWSLETEKKVISGVVRYLESKFMVHLKLDLKGLKAKLSLRAKSLEKEDRDFNAEKSRIDQESIHRALDYIDEVQHAMEDLHRCGQKATSLITSLVVSIARLRSDFSADKITARLGYSKTSSATSILIEQLKKAIQGQISILANLDDLNSTYTVFQRVNFDRIAEISKVPLQEFFFQFQKRKLSLEEIDKIVSKLDKRAFDIMEETELWDDLTSPMFVTPEYFKLMRELAVKRKKP